MDFERLELAITWLDALVALLFVVASQCYGFR